MSGFEPSNDAEWLLHELGGMHRSQVLSTLAALGVPDKLKADGPTPRLDLMARVDSFQDGFESLLRAGVGLGVLREDPPDTFALTARGEQLCSDRLGAFASFLGSSTQWDPWSRLRDSLRDDESRTAFEHAHRQPLYEWLAKHPAAAAEYDAAIDAFTRHEAEAIVAQLDVADARRIVDVGGGRGALLLAVLAKATAARGVLFDLPHVVDAARAELPERVEAVAGSFVSDVPAGGDVYLLKHVLHNWADGVAALILSRCKAAGADGGRIVVIDAVLSPDNRPDLARMLDLEMRVLCGGRERRRVELRRLFHGVGLQIEREHALPTGSWVFELR